MLRIMDIVIVTGLLDWITELVGMGSEPVAKALILAFCYLVFMNAFEFYRVEYFDRSRIWYAIALILCFSVAIGVLLQVAVFFKPTGRRVLLAHTLCMSVYLFLRARLMAGLQEGLQNIFVLSSGAEERMPADDVSILKKGGSVIRFSPNDTNRNGRGLIRRYFIIDDPKSMPEPYVKQMLQLKLKGNRVLSWTSFHELFFKQIPIDRIDASFFFELNSFHRANRMVYAALKRVFDLVLSTLLVVILSPFMVLVSVLIRLESPGKVLFRQTRTGRNGCPFTIIKFRSMQQDAEKNGAKWASESDPRITRVGGIIRKLRIDELPQLYNILKGDMSFIGPRPERPEFDSEFRDEIPFYMFRYLVKPGLTGWAQVNYGYGASLEDAKQKLQYDLYYVKNYSFQLDVEILIRTARIVLFAHGR